MDSQNARVLSMLRRKKSRGITAVDGFNARIFRLAARIHELRAAGYDIRTTMEDHEGGKHARYRLM